MKYEHQIDWANAYDTNLDDCTGRLVRNGNLLEICQFKSVVVVFLFSRITIHRTTLKIIQVEPNSTLWH